jgi:hypothetical protein
LRLTKHLSSTVQDTGIGIAPEDQERIFQEFTQVRNPMQQRVKGTGLGLPLSRKLAELLGGELTVLSLPEQGSKFTLTLPLQIASEAGQTGDSILIIDDEESDGTSRATCSLAHATALSKRPAATKAPSGRVSSIPRSSCWISR